MEKAKVFPKQKYTKKEKERCTRINMYAADQHLKNKIAVSMCMYVCMINCHEYSHPV